MRELMLANLFNSLPAFFSHTPTIFLLLWPALGAAALIYVGVTLLAAIGRTLFTILLARVLLPACAMAPATAPAPKSQLASRLQAALAKAWRRFQKRMPKLLVFTIPIYILMHIAQSTGFFANVEIWLASRLDWLAFLKPQAMGIIAMQLLAELGATLGAASAALATGSLTTHDVVIAMLAGNVLATPLRALRHQLPAYAAFYRPATAIKLIAANQLLRAASLAGAIMLYLACR